MMVRFVDYNTDKEFDFIHPIGSVDLAIVDYLKTHDYHVETYAQVYSGLVLYVADKYIPPHPQSGRWW